MNTIFLGVDTGGTFTDFVCIDDNQLRVFKTLSSPTAPQTAILKGIKAMGLSSAMAQGQLVIVHGTTVATNAVLQGRGVETAYIANKGLKDVIRIGRQTRQHLYNLRPAAPEIALDTDLLFEIDVRVDATGNITRQLADGALERLANEIEASKPDAIAVNLLFSFLCKEHEILIEEFFKDKYFVSRSSEILPEYGEYERGMTTWLNAYVGPIIQRYLAALIKDVSPSNLAIMQSSGLTIDANLAATKAVNLLLSGPAGGLAAAQYFSNLTQQPNLITFDMGGTSTDVALIEQRYKLTNSGTIAGYPVAVPMADIHTIGAGGGSIAYIDEGGLLQVGPDSAGANPGPACYDNAGTGATVTDANLWLGRLGPSPKLAGELPLNIDAARAALSLLAGKLDCSLDEVATGIIAIANEHMSQALRVISVQRGHDPREFALVCFGGAGGLHLCDLAESLDMTKAAVPIHGGVLSAFGMLTTKPGRELIQTHQSILSSLQDTEITAAFEALEFKAKLDLGKENITEMSEHRSLDMRYLGQTHTINVPYDFLSGLQARFHQSHQRQYGHQLDLPIEVVNLRSHIEAQREPIELPDWVAEQDPTDSEDWRIPYKHRSTMASGEVCSGPLLILEQHATTYVKQHWQVEIDVKGNLLLQKTSQKKPD
ncbi:MAG: hydantoinase/oxoprolinase family protein [Pseudomonadales bacterium]|nr:hydantoinase/oxoprolinase family protein [Pseudomonadales bacterium]